MNKISKKQYIHKTYALRNKRKTRNGETKTHTNYSTYLPTEYVEANELNEHVYIYWDGGLYVTVVQPDGSVPYKKLRVHVVHNRQYFIIPRKFFQVIPEDCKVLFEYFPGELDRFSGKPQLSIQLVVD